jgi:hypothetical protein
MYMVYPMIDDRRSSACHGLGGGSSVVLSRAGNNLSAFGTDTARAAASAPSVRSRRDQAHPTLESNVHDDEPLAGHVQAFCKIITVPSRRQQEPLG